VAVLIITFDVFRDLRDRAWPRFNTL